MHLMYTLDANGKRVYTLKKVATGEVTKSAHPARFSPDDKYSRYACPLVSLRLSMGRREEDGFGGGDRMGWLTVAVGEMQASDHD